MNDENKYDQLSPMACAKAMVDLKEEISRIKKQMIAPLQMEHDSLKYTIIPDKMDEMDISSINIRNLGRLTRSGQIQVKTIPEKKGELYQWLQDNGHGAIITETVNASTLAAFIREQMRDENEVPYDCIVVNHQAIASVTKK